MRWLTKYERVGRKGRADGQRVPGLMKDKKLSEQNESRLVQLKVLSLGAAERLHGARDDDSDDRAQFKGQPFTRCPHVCGGRGLSD